VRADSLVVCHCGGHSLKAELIWFRSVCLVLQVCGVPFRLATVTRRCFDVCQMFFCNSLIRFCLCNGCEIIYVALE
jgi:hypothetical protein